MSPPPAIPGVTPLTTDSEVLKARVLLKTLPYPVHEELTTLTGNQLIEVAKEVLKTNVVRRHGKLELIAGIVKGDILFISHSSFN